MAVQEKKMSLQELKKLVQRMTKEIIQESIEKKQQIQNNKTEQKVSLKELKALIRETVSESKWMQSAVHPGKKGAFTAKAKKHGMSVAQFAAHVLAHTKDFPEETVNQAKFAKSAKKVAKEHEKE